MKRRKMVDAPGFTLHDKIYAPKLEFPENCY
jgi:hypothetical protein